MGGLLGMLLGSAPGAAPGAEFAQKAMQNQGNLQRGRRTFTAGSGFTDKAFEELMRKVALAQQGMAPRAQQANVPFRKG